MSYNII